MKRAFILMMIMLLLSGCSEKPQQDRYGTVYELNHDLSRYSISLTSKIRDVYEDSMMTSNTESKVALDRQRQYADLDIRVYQQYDIIESRYHLENGILTTDYGRTEATLEDLAPLLEAIRLMLPKPQEVKSYELSQEGEGYKFSVEASDEFWDEVSDVHSGDVVEEFANELEEAKLEIVTDKDYSVLSEYIEYVLLIKDQTPYHLHLWINLEVLPFEE